MNHDSRLEYSSPDELPPSLSTPAGLRSAMVVLSAVGILSLVVALQIFKITENMNVLQSAMERSIDQRTQVRKMFSLIKDADLLHFRYILSGDQEDLRAFAVIRDHFEEVTGDLLEQLIENREQYDRVETLAEFAGARFEIYEDSAQNDLFVDQPWTPIENLPVVGTILVHELVEQMVDFEERQIRTASKKINEQTRRSRLISVITLGSVALLVAAVLLYGLLYLSSRNRAELVLLEANRLAEEANQAKTDFLATMSHEIRTPLTGVLGFTELLLKSDISGRQRELAQRIQTAGKYLSEIVNDILDFSKIEAGEESLDPRPFSLQEFIDNLISVIAVLADKKQLELRTQIDPNLPEVLVGDEARLRQVLLNLLGNAVKFTRKGYVKVDFQYQGACAEGERIRIEVQDTGIGFGPEKRDRLFTRFSQLDTSTGREFGGTGLGLAISKHLVELMGGTIDAESEKGVGTRFWINVTLPLAEDRTLPKVTSADVQSDASGYILLVEDSDQNQELISTILRGAGHRVDIASDGVQAINMVRKTHYDLVLMDIQLPRMDGPSATRVIRDLGPKAGKIPIIALTANVLPQQVTTFRKAGMNDFLAKPFTSGKLLSKINKWLSDEAGRSAPPLFDGTTPEKSHDPQTLLDIQNLMGETWVRKALRNLRDETIATFRHQDLKTVDRTVLKRKVHNIVSHSAQLGFFDLSRSCSEIEEICVRGGEFRSEIQNAQITSEQAIDTIKRILELPIEA